MSDKIRMDGSNRPRVSILIPNYNNGRQSSATGQRDLIGDLLQSLHDTLHDDPTPFEIIVYDDGSTDDSLATLRQWAQKTWPNGQSFLQLIEADHCGVLSKTANVLSRRARGEFLARLDGDVICLTRHWVSKLCAVFDQGAPRLGVVGPKQLAPNGKILAYGDWILHPNGYRHIAAGLPRHAVKFPLEVDHVMGCFYCCRKALYDELGGYDESILRGQTIDLGLRARLAGWFCLAVPHIEYIHAHTTRLKRQTRADSAEGIDHTLEVFERKWGFNRISPDLDEVRRRYANTPLLWNKRWFGDQEALNGCPNGASPPEEPIDFQRSAWIRYARDEAFRNQVHLRVSAALDLVRQVGKPRLLAQVGCGEGLIVHLLASQGLNCLGLDRRADYVQFARRCVANQKYPAEHPRFQAMPDHRTLPVGDGEVDLLVIFDELERNPNPVGLLKDAKRVVGPNHWLLIISQRPPAVAEDPSDPATHQGALNGCPAGALPFQHALADEHRYRWIELLGQVESVGGWEQMVDPARDDPSRDMIVVARRREEASAEAAIHPPQTAAGAA